MSRMHNPPHPGLVLQDTVLRADGGITLTAFAERLKVSRVALSDKRVVNGHAAISAELAIRLAAALGGSAESWLRTQVSYDLWHTTKKRRPKIEHMHLEHAHATQSRRTGDRAAWRADGDAPPRRSLGLMMGVAIARCSYGPDHGHGHHDAAAQQHAGGSGMGLTMMVVVVMFVITESWLIEHQSKAGAWTADQLAAIGVAWPPAQGWKHRSIGRSISDDARARFEQALRAKAARQVLAGSATLPTFSS